MSYFGVRQQLVPVVLSLAAADGEHFGHGMVDALDTAISAGLVLILLMPRRS